MKKTWKNCIHLDGKTKECNVVPFHYECMLYNHACITDPNCSDMDFAKLDLVLTHKWFDQIKSGQKTTEYRKKTPYWERRLEGVKKGDFIVFRRGYTNTTLTAAIVKITPYGYSELPQEVKDFMAGVEWGDLFYAIDFKLLAGLCGRAQSVS